MNRPSLASPVRTLALASLVAVGATAVLGGGCNRKTSGTRVAREDMALVPRETDIAFMVNVHRARKSPLWKKLVDARDQSAEAKKEYDEFVKKCQIDPLNQVDSIFLALPNNADQSHEYALLMRGGFPPESVLGCARRAAQDNAKQELKEVEYNGHKLYTTNQTDLMTVLDKGLVAFGGKEWIRKVVDLHDGRTPGEGAKDHKELAALLSRTRTGQLFFGAGLVPPKVGESLKRNPQLGAAAGMTSLFGSLDAQQGVEFHLGMDLSDEAAAGEMAGRLKEQLANARKNATVQLMGLSSYFDAVKVTAQKNTLTTDVELTQPQVEDLTTRLAGLAKQFLSRAGMGGDDLMMAPGGTPPGAPPGGTPVPAPAAAPAAAHGSTAAPAAK